MIQQKVEVRFEKGEAARFISHLDLMRAFQRAVRRADLPVRLTEGFNPRPRIVFPVALEVGVASLDEVAEIEFTQWTPLEILKERLARHLPPGLSLIALQEIPPTRKGQVPLLIRYHLHLKEAGLTCPPPEALTAFLASPALPFLRQRETQAPTTLDLKASVAAVEAVADGAVAVVIKPIQTARARPLEVLSLLLAKPIQELKTVRVTKVQMTLGPGKVPTPEAEAAESEPPESPPETEQP